MASALVLLGEWLKYLTTGTGYKPIVNIVITLLITVPKPINHPGKSSIMGGFPLGPCSLVRVFLGALGKKVWAKGLKEAKGIKAEDREARAVRRETGVPARQRT